MMKKAVLLIALFPCLVRAGDFKKARDGEYEFTGTMLPGDVSALRLIFATEKGPLRITVDSPGGYLSAGIEMAEVTSLMKDRVTMVAKECFSAAALWVAADRYEFYDDKSLVAFHLPWMSLGGTPIEQSIGDTSRMAVAIWESMRRTMDGPGADTVFQAMCDARDWKGINAFVVFRRNKPVQTGFWKPDGWEWQDGTLSRATRLDPFYIKP